MTFPPVPIDDQGIALQVNPMEKFINFLLIVIATDLIIPW